VGDPLLQGFGKGWVPDGLAIKFVEQFRDQATLPGDRQGPELRDRVGDHVWQDTELRFAGKRFAAAPGQDFLCRPSARR
jgi:hypothetical protein